MTTFFKGDRVKYIGDMTAGLVGQLGTVVSETYNDHNIEVRWDRATNDTRGDRTSGVYPSNIRRATIGDHIPPVVNVPFQYQGTVKGTIDSGVQALPENLPKQAQPDPALINWQKRAQNAEFDLAVVRGVSAARLEQIADAEKRIDDLKQQLEDEKGRTQLWLGVAARRYQKINDLLQEIKVLKNQAKDDEDYISLQARRLVKRVEQINDIRRACDVDVGLDP